MLAFSSPPSLSLFLIKNGYAVSERSQVVMETRLLTKAGHMGTESGERGKNREGDVPE